MIRPIALLTTLLADAYSAPVKAGCDFQPSIIVTKSEGRFANGDQSHVGVKIRPGLEIPLSDGISMRTLAGYERRMGVALFPHDEMVGYEDFKAQYLTLDVVGQFMATNAIRISGGAGYAFHLKTIANSDGDQILSKNRNVVSVSTGFGYQLGPKLSIEIGYQNHLGSIRFQDMDLSTQAVNFGLRYDLPISGD